MIYNARRRAAKLGIECTITVHDLLIPEFCPVLGIPLKRGTIKQTSNSPSIDRIRSDQGYTPNNIWVISLQANRMKSNATNAELLRFAAWINDNIDLEKPDGTVKAGTGLGG